MANLLYRTSTTPPLPGSISAKGSPLLNSEIDGNFKSLNDQKLEVSDAVSTNTPNTVVLRDGSGGFAAGTIIGTNFVSTNTVNTVVRRDASGNFAANIVTVVDLNSTSDANLKTNVKPFDGLAKLSDINPVEFKWKSSGDTSYGVIAQELEKILPELVAEKDGIKNVSYIPMIAMLIDAVKKLDQRVKQLENLDK